MLQSKYLRVGSVYISLFTTEGLESFRGGGVKGVVGSGVFCFLFFRDTTKKQDIGCGFV